MFEMLDAGSDGIVGVKIHGKVTADDVKELAGRLETAIATSNEPVRLLTDMTEFRGMEVAAVWEDLRFTLRHMRDFERVAVIGDQAWLEWWITTTNPLVPAEARQFCSRRSAAAWAWLRERG